MVPKLLPSLYKRQVSLRNPCVLHGATPLTHAMKRITTLSYAEVADDFERNSQVPIVTRRPQLQIRWSRKRLLILGLILASLVIALVIGLAVGLTRRNDADASSASGQNLRPGVTWNYEINGAIEDPIHAEYDVWDIDLFSNNKSTVSSLRARGSLVLCYFSAGSYEDWRSDANNFSTSDLGNDLAGWPGEKWLNVSSQSVRDIMLRRLDVASERLCDGVDPDNMDGYNNDNGLGLTRQNSIDYMHFLAEAANQRNLFIGLKNAAEIVPQVIDIVHFSVNEQCVAYDECDTFSAFIRQGKPVFHVEYPKGDDVNNSNDVSSTVKNKVCDAIGESNFSTIIKNMNLDSWIQQC